MREKTDFEVILLVSVIAVLFLGMFIMNVNGKVRDKNKTTGEVVWTDRQIREISFWERTDAAPAVERVTLIREEKRTLVRFFLSGEEVYEQSESLQLMEQVQELFEKYEVETWDGFHEEEENILDGISFGLEVVFTDGKKISAQGNNVFPTNYQQVFQMLHTLTEPVLEKCRQNREQR